MTTLAWGAKVDENFRERVRFIAEELGADPSHLMSCMAFETGRTFSPSIKNPASSATGLIQFMRDTAVGLGTTVEELAQMTALEQLEYVRQYFLPYAGKLGTLADCYAAVIWPRAVGKPDDYVVFGKGSSAYEHNAALDFDKNGAVTKGECAAVVQRYLEEGFLPTNAATIAAPITEIDLSGVPLQPEKSTMPLPILALISAFGPQLIAMIPQFAALFDHKTSTPEKLCAATKALDIVVQASGASNVQDAVEKMQADPTLIKTVTNAVVTDSTIQPMLSIVEIGGGIAGAREADRAQQDSDKPFYKTSAVFWISLMLMPMVLWYVGSSIVGGIDIPPDWPWYAQLPLKLFGTSWDAGAKVGLANLVVGMILGGIVGVYYGVSVTQSKQQLPTKDQA